MTTDLRKKQIKPDVNPARKVRNGRYFSCSDKKINHGGMAENNEVLRAFVHFCRFMFESCFAEM